jgi:hypothetical protein
MSARTTLLHAGVSLATIVLMASTASAMSIKQVGNQLILSGRVLGGEYDQVADLLPAHPDIDTVILRNSPGGDIPTGYRLGELFRAKGIHTAVSGYCYSSCSRMFLGGRYRSFTDDVAPDATHVGFHGHYGGDGKLRADLVDRFGLKAWVIKYSDGKADATLVERWVHIPFARGMAHFFPPQVAQQHGAATYMCRGDEPSPRKFFDCEPIEKSALDLGVVTSPVPVHSNDQDTLRTREMR